MDYLATFLFGVVLGLVGGIEAVFRRLRKKGRIEAGGWVYEAHPLAERRVE